MTRTYLIELGRTVQKHSKYHHYIDDVNHAMGEIYEAVFLSRPILFYFADNHPIAAIYKHTLYAIRPTSARRAGIIRGLYLSKQCTTKVFLYSTTNVRLYRDDEGVVYDPLSISKNCDYADVIPIPTV